MRRYTHNTLFCEEKFVDGMLHSHGMHSVPCPTLPAVGGMLCACLSHAVGATCLPTGVGSAPDLGVVFETSPVCHQFETDLGWVLLRRLLHYIRMSL